MLTLGGYRVAVFGGLELFLACLVSAGGWIEKIETCGQFSVRIRNGSALVIDRYSLPDPMVRSGLNTHRAIGRRRRGKLCAGAQGKHQDGATKMGSGFHRLREGLELLELSR